MVTDERPLYATDNDDEIINNMVMLKTCARCGGLHGINDGVCQTRRYKKSTEVSRFRSHWRWRKKSERVRERDHHLCQICLIDAFDTLRTFTYGDLEVNHIVPLEELKAAGEDLMIAGLDETNLLTMCIPHHKLADSGVIPRQLMLDLAAKIENHDKIVRRLKHGEYPPVHQVKKR